MEICKLRLVSLLSVCHSLDLTKSSYCIFTEVSLQIWSLLSGRPGFKPLSEGATRVSSSKKLKPIQLFCC